ncbi:hypothetical protein M9H77_17151 [Catharanthus roseus]|uniref:Uncharacterized protein n=1 Tax=Catharanthus roseus TaxID=4058 RepID=A0ACC0B463_CATRO|nr:hypothetical protein M9H77_17151 [Catharanthus roseus]
MLDIMKKPLSGWLKPNFDASWESPCDTTSVIITRDEKGKLLEGNNPNKARDPFEAEALTALHAIKLAQRKGFSLVVLEEDTLNVLRSLQGHSNAEQCTGKELIHVGKAIMEA